MHISKASWVHLHDCIIPADLSCLEVHRGPRQHYSITFIATKIAPLLSGLLAVCVLHIFHTSAHPSPCLILMNLTGASNMVEICLILQFTAALFGAKEVVSCCGLLYQRYILRKTYLDFV